MQVFSTNHVCIWGSSTVQGSGITGVLLPGQEDGLEGRRAWQWNSVLQAGWCGKGSVLCDLPMSRACRRAGLSIRVCTLKLSRFLTLLLWWMLFIHLYHFRQKDPQCLWVSSSEIGNTHTAVAHPGCSLTKIARVSCRWKSDVPTLSQRVMCQAFSSINLPIPIIKSLSIWLSLAIKPTKKNPQLLSNPEPVFLLNQSGCVICHLKAHLNNRVIISAFIWTFCHFEH